LRAHPYGALPMKGWEEKIRKDHIKALDKGDLVLIIFVLGLLVLVVRIDVSQF
jgi:hypothetical protein